MSEKQFKETTIPEDFAHSLMTNSSFIITPVHVIELAKVLFGATSTVLGKIKDVKVPKAIVFNHNHKFIAAAKVSYEANENNPDDLSAGFWNYVWTTSEDDIEDCKCEEIDRNAEIARNYELYAGKNNHMRFDKPGAIGCAMNLLIEVIKVWLEENPGTTLVLDGFFKGVSENEDDEVFISIIPDGDMKILIKDDSSIQN